MSRVKLTIADKRLAISSELVQAAAMFMAHKFMGADAGADPEARERGRMVQFALKGLARLMLMYAEWEIKKSGSDRPLPDWKTAKQDVVTYTIGFLLDDLIDGMSRYEWVASYVDAPDGTLEITGMAPALTTDGTPGATAEHPAELETSGGGPIGSAEPASGLEPTLVRGGSDTGRQNDMGQAADYQSTGPV